MRNSMFFVGKMFHKYEDSSANIGSVWETCSVRYNHCKMVLQEFDDGRTNNRCGKQERPTSVSTFLRLSRFRQSQKTFGWRQFSNDNQIQTAVLCWFQHKEAVFYRQGLERLVQLFGKCLQRLGDCVEKGCGVCVPYCITENLTIKYFLNYIIRM